MCRRSVFLSFVLIAVLPATAGAQDRTVPRPTGLNDDSTVWPNARSSANSDEWLWRHHDKLRKLEPRVVVLNFANNTSMDAVRKQTAGFIKALGEASRYHGYANPDAPVFLEYQVVKYIDLRDPAAKTNPERTYSALMPKQQGEQVDAVIDYAGLFTDAFAEHYGFADPRTPGRYLNLKELIEFGIVNELWFYAPHLDGPWPGRETCEAKQYYDDKCRPIKGKHGPAGNGHSATMPWVGRSFRIAFFNPERGVGCMLENFGHQLEAIANHNAVAYYRRYFNEYAELNLDEKYDLPFRSFYALWGADNHVTYPDQDTAVVTYKGEQYTIDPYISVAGNVHFPPGGRDHYDRTSPHTVLARIENYRRRNGPAGQDKLLPFNKEKFQRYQDVAPDCMGAWLVYWMQNLPGLENQSVDDAGRPMKNWWVFLFY